MFTLMPEDPSTACGTLFYSVLKEREKNFTLQQQSSEDVSEDKKFEDVLPRPHPLCLQQVRAP